MASFNNEYSDTVVTGTNGNDFISNYDSGNVTISGGGGHDTVNNGGYYKGSHNTSISGDDGNDSIYN